MFTEPVACPCDSNGHDVFRDQNGEVFEYVLDYLRDGQLFLPADPVRMQQLKRERACVL